MITEHFKLTMQKLAELEDKKVWDNIYFKCAMCQEIKRISGATLLTSHPTIDSRVEEGNAIATVKEICEVVCNDCLKHFPKAPLFPSDIIDALYSGKYDGLTAKEFREKMEER